MGTRFSVYEYDKETNALSPPSIPRHPTFVTDIAPASRWNYELLEDEGEQKMRELVSEVKRMCQDITECTSFNSCLRRSLLASLQFHLFRRKDDQHIFLHADSVCRSWTVVSRGQK